MKSVDTQVQNTIKHLKMIIYITKLLRTKKYKKLDDYNDYMNITIGQYKFQFRHSTGYSACYVYNSSSSTVYSTRIYDDMLEAMDYNSIKYNEEIYSLISSSSGGFNLVSREQIISHISNDLLFNITEDVLFQLDSLIEPYVTRILIELRKNTIYANISYDIINEMNFDLFDCVLEELLREAHDVYYH